MSLLRMLVSTFTPNGISAHFWGLDWNAETLLDARDTEENQR